MQKRGMARWLGVQHRLEEKRQKPPKSFEVPSKYHRRSFVTSRSHHAYHTPAARSQQAGRAGAGQWGLGELAELKRLPNQAGAEGLLSDQDTLDVE